MSRRSGGSFTFFGMALLFQVGFWCFLSSMLAFWTRYELSYWVSHVTGTPTTVPYWKAFVVSLFMPLALFADIVSFLVRLFM